MRLFPETIPTEIKNSKCWSMWKKELNAKGEMGKVPYQLTGWRAESDNPDTWCAFDAALIAFQDVGGFDGICWMMPVEPSDIIFIDIDHCIKDGIIEPWALEIIEQFNSYTERSQSGNGLHILIKGQKPIKRCRKHGSPFEIYDSLRPCYLTGDVVDAHTTIEYRQEPLDRLYEAVFSKELEQARADTAQRTSPARSSLSDDALILKATLAKGGNEFKALFDGSTLGYGGDDSAADMALMNKFAFWTDGNALQMERLFSASGLGQREKWRTRPDYRERTIRKAISDAREFYKPQTEEQHPNETEAERQHREFTAANIPITRARADMIEAKTGVHIYNADDDPKQCPVMSAEEFDAFKLDSGPKFTCNLPGDNFISRFMQYGSEISDAYKDYWFAGAIFALGVVTDKKLKFSLRQMDIFTNIFIYIAGGSTLARKTTVHKKTARMLEDVIGIRFDLSKVPNEFSPEAFIEHMDSFNHAAWVRDEAAGVLSLMKKDYMRGFKDTLMQLYDCTRVTRTLRTSQRKAEKTSFDIADPYLNVFFASTDASLGANTEANDALSGFLARFLFFYPQGEKTNYMPLSKGTAYHSELEEIARVQLKEIVALMDSMPECVDMNYTPEAQAYYEEWQERRERELAPLKDGFSSQIFGRLIPGVIKFAMLFEVGSKDFNPTTPIRLEHFVEACRLMDEYFLPMARSVYELVGQTEEKNVIDKIIAYLKRNGGRATQRETARAVKIKSKELTEYISTMLDYDMIEQREKDNGGKGRNQVYLFLKETNGIEVPKVPKVSNVTNVPNNGDSCIIDKPGTLATLARLETNETLTPNVEESNVKQMEPSPTMGPHPRKDQSSPADPERERFKAGVQRRSKNTCRLCGQHFEVPLTISYQGGYICEPCRRDGPAPELAKADEQAVLGEV